MSASIVGRQSFAVTRNVLLKGLSCLLRSYSDVNGPRRNFDRFFPRDGIGYGIIVIISSTLFGLVAKQSMCLDVKLQHKRDFLFSR
jgi:hypothetical protein